MWIEKALTVLEEARTPSGGWGYRPQGTPWSEPTALVALAHAAHGREANGALDWLASIQRPNGSIGVSAAYAAPGWPTPLAILAWQGAYATEREKATMWLLQEEGKALDDPEAIAGHDTTIVGWPWVEGTHSWIEPTALAVMALKKSGHGDHARVRDGIRLLRDRALPTKGGWNYGNNTIFGRELRPQPAPTGMALLALAAEADPITLRACAYLEGVLPSVRAPMSLAWGLLGLGAFGRRPSAADAWLEESFARASARTDDLVMHLALLVLAASDRSLALFGVR